jgi:hypothetical protein
MGFGFWEAASDLDPNRLRRLPSMNGEENKRTYAR